MFALTAARILAPQLPLCARRAPLSSALHSPSIPGLHLVSDSLTREEHARAVAELDVFVAATPPSARPTGGRRIFNVAGESAISQSFPVLASLIARVVSAYANDARLPPLRTPNALQVNEYDADGGCPLHVDARSIGDVIGMFSFASECVMTLAPEEAVAAAGDAAVFAAARARTAIAPFPAPIQVRLRAGSLLVLSGEARTLWAHGIERGVGHVNTDGSPVPRSRRLSAVFWRTLDAHSTAGNGGGWAWERKRTAESIRFANPTTARRSL